MKKPLTKEEIAARVAWYKDWSDRLDKINEESPLPDDFEEYCKGRKWHLADGTVVSK
jgi:hypothetical protein